MTNTETLLMLQLTKTLVTHLTKPALLRFRSLQLAKAMKVPRFGMKRQGITL